MSTAQSRVLNGRWWRANRTCCTRRRSRSRRFPSPVEVPDFAHLLPEPIRPFTRSIQDSEHLSFIQGAGHGGSHPHLVNEFVSRWLQDRDPWPNAVDLRQLDVRRHLRSSVGPERRRESCRLHPGSVHSCRVLIVARLRPASLISSNSTGLVQRIIDALNESGGAPDGVVAGVAIAAVEHAQGKLSRAGMSTRKAWTCRGCSSGLSAFNWPSTST